MRRIVLWVMSTATVLVLLFGYHTSTSSKGVTGSRGVLAAPITGGTDDPGTAGSQPTDPSTPATTDPGTTTAPAAPTGGAAGSTAKSGTVTGDSVDTRWGPVQVQLTVSAGKITRVSVPVYPDNNRRDEEINAQALPILVRETLKAQGADIDMVSGATVTSDGYIGSLQSALDKAGL